MSQQQNYPGHEAGWQHYYQTSNTQQWQQQGYHQRPQQPPQRHSFMPPFQQQAHNTQGYLHQHSGQGQWRSNGYATSPQQHHRPVRGRNRKPFSSMSRRSPSTVVSPSRNSPHLPPKDFKTANVAERIPVTAELPSNPGEVVARGLNKEDAATSNVLGLDYTSEEDNDIPTSASKGTTGKAAASSPGQQVQVAVPEDPVESEDVKSAVAPEVVSLGEDIEEAMYMAAQKRIALQEAARAQADAACAEGVPSGERAAEPRPVERRKLFPQPEGSPAVEAALQAENREAGPAAASGKPPEVGQAEGEAEAIEAAEERESGASEEVGSQKERGEDPLAEGDGAPLVARDVGAGNCLMGGERKEGGHLQQDELFAEAEPMPMEQPAARQPEMTVAAQQQPAPHSEPGPVGSRGGDTAAEEHSGAAQLHQAHRAEADGRGDTPHQNGEEADAAMPRATSEARQAEHEKQQIRPLPRDASEAQQPRVRRGTGRRGRGRGRGSSRGGGRGPATHNVLAEKAEQPQEKMNEADQPAPRLRSRRGRQAKAKSPPVESAAAVRRQLGRKRKAAPKGLSSILDASSDSEIEVAEGSELEEDPETLPKRRKRAVRTRQPSQRVLRATRSSKISSAEWEMGLSDVKDTIVRPRRRQRKAASPVVQMGPAGLAELEEVQKPTKRGRKRKQEIQALDPEKGEDAEQEVALGQDHAARNLVGAREGALASLSVAARSPVVVARPARSSRFSGKKAKAAPLPRAKSKKLYGPPKTTQPVAQNAEQLYLGEVFAAGKQIAAQMLAEEAAPSVALPSAETQPVQTTVAAESSAPSEQMAVGQFAAQPAAQPQAEIGAPSEEQPAPSAQAPSPRLAVVPSRPVASKAWKFEDAKDFFELVTQGTDIETLFPDDWDWDDSFKDFVRQKVAAVTAEKLKAEEQKAVCDREAAEFEKAERQEEAHKEAEVAAQRQQLELVTQQTQGLRAQCQEEQTNLEAERKAVDAARARLYALQEECGAKISAAASRLGLVLI